MLINKTNLTLFGLAAEFNFRAGLRLGGPSRDFFSRVATIVPSSTKENVYPMIGQWPKFREWIGDRSIKKLEANQYRLANRKFENTVEVSIEDLEDDNLGLYPAAFQTAGDSAVSLPNELVADVIVDGFTTGRSYDDAVFFGDHEEGGALVSNLEAGADGIATPWVVADLSRPIKPFLFQDRARPMFQPPPPETAFDHDVLKYGMRARCAAGYGLWQLAYGSKNELDNDAVDAAIEAVMSRKNDEGRPLGISPTHLICGVSRRSQARAVLEAALISGGDTNTNYKALELMVVPWLP